MDQQNTTSSAKQEQQPNKKETSETNPFSTNFIFCNWWLASNKINKWIKVRLQHFSTTTTKKCNISLLWRSARKTSKTHKNYGQNVRLGIYGNTTTRTWNTIVLLAILPQHCYISITTMILPIPHPFSIVPHCLFFHMPHSSVLFGLGCQETYAQNKSLKPL